MLNWCAYCLRYIGLKPPVDNFEITHGICRRCMAGGAFCDVKKMNALKQIRAFFMSLRTEAFENRARDAKDVFDEGLRLGIRPPNLILGICQPILLEIGNRFAHGDIPIRCEHAFTALTERLFFYTAERIKSERGNVLPDATEPNLLLVATDQNFHTLGLRILSLVLDEEAMPHRLFYPGLPNDEIIELVAEHHPRVLGVSIASDAAFAVVEQLVDELRVRDFPVEVMVGGAVLVDRQLPESLRPKVRAAPLSIDELTEELLSLCSAPDPAPRQAC